MFLMYPCFVVEEILGMKENIGVIYDTSPQVDEVVEVLLGSLSLARQSARPSGRCGAAGCAVTT